MRLHLLGTGSADGWPSAFCGCASCGAERRAGRSRGQTAALLDGTVLLDCGPSTATSAERAGVSLRDVRVLLFTHQHSDHCSPATLMHRAWVTDAPLTVVGPPDVITACRPWLPPDTAVDFVPVAPGDALELEGYAVRVLASSHRTGLGDGSPDAVLYDVTAPSGQRLLYATDTGPLPPATVAAARDAAYDVVLLEETFGDHVDHGTDHLDLTTFPEQVRRLREAGAVTAHTDLVAVHLSHHNPPTPELERRLADWGARIVDDGALIEPAEAGSEDTVEPCPLRTLVLGGARSGKSREAERILAGSVDVTYLATSYPAGDDAEWADRIAAHRRKRPAAWTTVESLDIAGLLRVDGGPVLVDCLTLWLTRVMDQHDAWDDTAWRGGAEERVAGEIADLVDAWRGTRRRVVAVSNEVGQGVVPDTSAGRRFRDLMGRVNAHVAAQTEDVRLCVAGRVVVL
ncbi:bifunctional adenosylcobinamide kinase/adenosylcobinamide-phosphate guanylyltransferase [Nocardioides sp.]|uniref:bifunctional adenosylcobinamide kinase/adenosylcobinamide-phosphate guanylyltransferase n=1 Tax=Nocardioides sp. TaxID=35761 RepID=UPI002733BC7A|nr:bifunctional adenosylcobinamide kinase/adenosylcobinamide-phosphate guanylyltransferase [Nocardioides sp.]MDP3890071.1 bifunctional adenosylcobinamide kinase/adenosylcobinamide-phosphate guanylyltransferase [Nocardioides sp.]